MITRDDRIAAYKEFRRICQELSIPVALERDFVMPDGSKIREPNIQIEATPRISLSEVGLHAHATFLSCSPLFDVKTRSDGCSFYEIYPDVIDLKNPVLDTAQYIVGFVTHYAVDAYDQPFNNTRTVALTRSFAVDQVAKRPIINLPPLDNGGVLRLDVNGAQEMIDVLNKFIKAANGLETFLDNTHQLPTATKPLVSTPPPRFTKRIKP